MNLLAIFSFVFATAEPLNRYNNANTVTRYSTCEDVLGLLAGLLGVAVHALREMALSLEPAPLVHPV